MCGICGKLQFDRAARVEPELLGRMMSTLSHRGPDGRGQYVSGPVGLGHTRLAIIDLNTGAQPISNEDQSVWVVFNGEIYNYPALRRLLLQRGHRFQTNTDTEVIVHLYEEYGAQCLDHLQGMFAIALWDDQSKTLLLARDRVGIKPLFYTETSGGILFGSEIKALLQDPEVRCEVNPQSIDRFLTHFCLPGRDTLWKGIFKLEPGHYLLVQDGKLHCRKYWDLQYPQNEPYQCFADAVEALRELTQKTVREHMISDVPVGCLLSGGVDSTIVLSCAAKETAQRISTFTVGFENAHFEDERVYARIAAKHFGTDHHEITISPQEFWDYLPMLARQMEEPVCDPPAISLHYISRLACQHVKVLLSGEGGDEAFGGYNEYRNFQYLEMIKTAIHPLEGILSSALELAGKIPGFRKVGKFAPFVNTALPDYYYSRVASPFHYFNIHKTDIYTRSFQETISPNLSTEIIRSLFAQVKGNTPLAQMQYIDTKSSLPEDLLVKADRMTMGNSMELRVPFLDHLLLEFAARLPANHKVRGFQTKRILKSAFKDSIPMPILKRKKAGFPIPVGRWLQSELRDQVREVLLSRRSLDRCYFTRSGIERLLALGDQGAPVIKEIFSLLTLEYLHAEFVDL